MVVLSPVTLREPFSIPLRAATGLRVIGRPLAGKRLTLKTVSEPIR